MKDESLKDYGAMDNMDDALWNISGEIIYATSRVGEECSPEPAFRHAVKGSEISAFPIITSLHPDDAECAAKLFNGTDEREFWKDELKNLSDRFYARLIMDYIRKNSLDYENPCTGARADAKAASAIGRALEKNDRDSLAHFAAQVEEMIPMGHEFGFRRFLAKRMKEEGEIVLDARISGAKPRISLSVGGDEKWNRAIPKGACKDPQKLCEAFAAVFPRVCERFVYSGPGPAWKKPMKQ